MSKTTPLLASALLLAACGRTIATSAVSQSQLAPPDAFQCVMKQFEQLGFERTMYDKDELRTNAKKVNPKITFSNVQFRKTWDRLDVEISPGAAGTDVKVTPSTVAEYFSQAGPIYNPLETSAEAQGAAATIQRECGGAQAPAQAPAPYAPPQQ